jgi:hypothetical protein
MLDFSTNLPNRLIIALDTVCSSLLVLIHEGGASVPVNGAVFKTVCETVRAVLGWFDSDTPPPTKLRNLKCVMRNSISGKNSNERRIIERENAESRSQND